MDHKLLVVIILLFFIGCVSDYPELVTSEAVDVYEKPSWPDVVRNQKIGVLPANTVVKVKSETLGKDLLAYQIDYLPPSGGTVLNGYVLHGSKGLKVKNRQAQNH